MRLAALLLVCAISLHKCFSPLPSPDNIVNFVPPRGGWILCEGRVADVHGSGSSEKIVADRLRCLNKEMMYPFTGRVRLTVNGSYWFIKKKLIRDGDLIRFSARIRRPRDFRNFGRTPFEDHYYARQISAVGFVQNPSWIVKVGSDRNWLSDLLFSWRSVVEEAAADGLGRGEEFHLVKAIVLGDKSGLSPELMSDFKVLGVVHLLVVSGLHVAVLAGLSWWLVILIGSLFTSYWGQRDLRIAAAALSILSAWSFVALTGFGIPAVRAGLIATVFLGSIMIRRHHDPWDCLSFSAIVILVINPAALFDVSFQLTYSAVCGILVFKGFMIGSKKKVGLLKKILIIIYDAIVISVGASCGVLPLIAYHFGKVPTLGPLTSLILSPIITIVVVPLALVSSLVTLLSAGFGVWLFSLLSAPVAIFINLSEWLADAITWSFITAEPTGWSVVSLYMAVIAIMCWKWRKIYAMFAAIVFLGVGLIMSHPLENHEGQLAVTFLDVGQGASVVVKLPDGRVSLIDGGGIKGSNFDLGRSVLVPFLNQIGIEKVDRLIVTHPHPDHFMGLASIAEDLDPNVCMVGGYPEERLAGDELAEWQAFLKRVGDAGVVIERLEPSAWEESGVSFRVLSPPVEIPDIWSVNDSSVVIKIGHGEVSFLITGDIEGHVEEYLLDSDFDIASTVLQVPHHGSSTSSSAEFLDEVSPKYGVIQVGAFNEYGFPNEDVMERLGERGIKTFRTDIDGAITFVADEGQLKVFSAVSR